MSPRSASLASARRVADAVLYEGYLLYPYRASSDKNRARWQFGVLGPPGAAEAGVGEPARMALQTVLVDVDATARLVVHVRFLQLRRRTVLDAGGAPVEQLLHAGGTALSWDEAEEQEHEVVLGQGDLTSPLRREILVPGAVEREDLHDAQGRPVGQVVRTSRPLRATLEAAVHRDDSGRGPARLDLCVTNAHERPVADKDEAVAVSLLGAHLLVEAHGGGFGSVIDPSPGTERVAAGCRQERCWPVLAGDPGTSDLLLGSPIILEDHPAVAEESAGDLFDATEIDEILTLRVLTLTDEEKAEARDTDPRARAIIDRCEQMSPEEMQRLHGVLRDPRADHTDPGPPVFGEPDAPWWDPAADSAVDPDTDTVVIEGLPVGRGSLVRVHPQRRADAQDLFFADQVARVTAVLHDVDGGVHIALVLVDDPAADLHDWYGRYFYFAPEEVSPLGPDEARRHPPTQREESRP